MRLLLDFLFMNIKKIALICCFSLLIFIFILAFILLLQIDSDQKLIKDKLNQVNLEVLQIETKISNLESSIINQQKINIELNDQILNIQNQNPSNSDTIGQITVVRLVDPLDEIQKDFRTSSNNRLIALEIRALAINAEIGIRTTYFNISYIDNEITKSDSNNQSIVIKGAQKKYAGFEEGIENRILAAGSDLTGWISFEIPINAKIVGFSFDNGVVAANLQIPSLVD
jgi:hypothetical protein